MDDSENYSLSCYIQLGNGCNSICIPLFNRFNENALFVPRSSASLQIEEFSPIYDFEGQIRRLNYDAVDKFAFILGDLCPIIIASADSFVYIHGSSIDELIDRISEINDGSAGPLTTMETICKAARSSSYGTHAIRSEAYKTQIDEFNSQLEPRASRLWVDEALAFADERIQRQLPPELAIAQLRLSLLSWTQEVIEFATGPITKHFFSSVRKAKRLGVQTDDIHAAVIVKRAAGTQGFSELVNPAAAFRSEFGQGPISILDDLSQTTAGPFFERAEQLKSLFYDRIASAIQRQQGSEIRALRLYFDRKDQIPPRVLRGVDAIFEGLIEMHRQRKLDQFVLKEAQKKLAKKINFSQNSTRTRSQQDKFRKQVRKSKATKIRNYILRSRPHLSEKIPLTNDTQQLVASVAAELSAIQRETEPRKSFADALLKLQSDRRDHYTIEATHQIDPDIEATFDLDWT